MPKPPLWPSANSNPAHTSPLARSVSCHQDNCTWLCRQPTSQPGLAVWLSNAEINWIGYIYIPSRWRCLWNLLTIKQLLICCSGCMVIFLQSCSQSVWIYLTAIKVCKYLSGPIEGFIWTKLYFKWGVRYTLEIKNKTGQWILHFHDMIIISQCGYWGSYWWPLWPLSIPEFTVFLQNPGSTSPKKEEKRKKPCFIPIVIVF